MKSLSRYVDENVISFRRPREAQGSSYRLIDSSRKSMIRKHCTFSEGSHWFICINLENREEIGGS